MDTAGHYGQDYHNGSRLYKANKVFVVSLAHASSQPWAMMIQPFYTTVANATMNGSRRSVDITSGTVLNLRQSTLT